MLAGCAKPAAPSIGVAGVRRASRISVNAPGKVKSVTVSLDGKKIKTSTRAIARGAAAKPRHQAAPRW